METSLFRCNTCSSKNISSVAIRFCSECQSHFCQQCVENHDLNAAFWQHNWTEMGSVTFGNTCSKHKGRTVDFFCVEHDCLSCQSCMTDDHFFCQKLVPLEEAANDVKQSVIFHDVSNALASITATIDKVIKSQKENIEALDNDEDAIISQVARIKDGLIQQLNELEVKIREETKLLTKEQKSKSESSKNILLRVARPIKDISDQIEQVSKNGSQRQMFVLIHKCKLEIVDLEIKLQDILQTIETRKIVFQPPDNITNTVISLGSTKLNCQHYNAVYRVPKMHQVQMPTFAPEMPTNFSLERKIEIKHSGNVFSSRICITDDNRLLLCSYGSPCLLVYSYNGDDLNDCKLSSYPRDITVIHGEDKAIVTLPDQHLIQFIDIKTMTPGSTHSVPGHCYGVTIVDDSICIAGYGRYIHILDKQGNHKNTLTVPGTGYIHYLYPGPNKSVYYTDTTFNAVGCITLEGVQRFIYTSVNLKSPHTVITDRKGNLYVTCSSSNNIYRLTQNGEFLGVILNERNDIAFPSGMVFSNDYRKLFVMNKSEGDRFILVFSCS